MSPDEQMSPHSTIVDIIISLKLDSEAETSRWIDLLRKLSIQLDFCPTNDLISTTVFNKGLLED